MRPIDADALIEFIDPGHLRHPGELVFSELDVVNMLQHAPTAYDIDRVMEQLSLERSKAVISLGESKGTAYEFCDRCVLDAYEKAIAIVKGKRLWSVIPDTEGDGTDALIYKGSFKAAGEIVKGTATTTDGWKTCTFSEA